MHDLRRLSGYLLRHKWSLLGAVACAIVAAIVYAGALGVIKNLILEETRAMTPGVSASAPSTDLSSPGAGAPAVPPATTEPAAATHEVRGKPTSLPLPAWAARWGARVDGLKAPFEHWLRQNRYVRVPVLLVLLYLIKGLCDFFAEYGLVRVGFKAVARLREEVYARALSQSDAFYRTHTTAEMMSRISGDTMRLQRILGADIGQAAQSIPVAAIMFLAALVFAWPLTLFVTLALPVFALAVGRFGRRIKKSARRSQERSAEMAGVIEETLIARRVVQAFGAVRYEIERFRAKLAEVQRQDLKSARVTAMAPPTMEILAAVAGATTIFVGRVMYERGLVDGAGAVMAIVALAVVFTHVQRIGRLNTTAQQALASARRVFEILDEPIALTDRGGARPVPPFARDLCLQRVSFGYGRGPVLSNIDLTIRRGEAHALVGPSGAGKTTLALLLPRFIDPTEGRVLIDGHDLRDVTLESLRAQIAFVSQETHLFDGTVTANIAYGRAGADTAAIESAARAAFAHDFIAALPRGYDTPLGERGGQLSAGQRQRIAIARAFLKDAPILILDEATSALDAESERQVQLALEALLAGRTALIIAHRLSTVQRADVIHVLEHGRIVEQGTHRELLDAGGHYARLRALQTTEGSQRSGAAG